MWLAHEVPMAGHLGITKTKDRVLQRCYWPGAFNNIAQYCCLYEVCQRDNIPYISQEGLVCFLCPWFPAHSNGFDQTSSQKQER